MPEGMLCRQQIASADRIPYRKNIAKEYLNTDLAPALPHAFCEYPLGIRRIRLRPFLLSLYIIAYLAPIRSNLSVGKSIVLSFAQLSKMDIRE